MKMLETEVNMPPPVRSIQQDLEQSYLFQDALKKLESPEDKRKFKEIFSRYLNDSYLHNPKMNSLIKSHDLSDKLLQISSEDLEDPRRSLKELVYSEPGRTYPYVNNFLGNTRNKKDLLRRTTDNVKDFTLETLPGIVGAGGWMYANKWYKTKAAQGILGRTASTLRSGMSSGFKNPFKLGFNILTSPARVAGNEGAFRLVGQLLSPAKYVLGAYFLYKTIRFFTNKYKDRKELEEIARKTQLSNPAFL